MRPIEQLYRYPVKGLSPEPVAAARVEPGQGFPCNRMFALALSDTPFDPAAPMPQPKTRFLMLQRDETLAQIRRLDSARKVRGAYLEAPPPRSLLDQKE